MRVKSVLAAALTLALCLVLGFEAKAAEFKRMPQADGPDIIGIYGPINLGDNAKFTAIIEDLKDVSKPKPHARGDEPGPEVISEFAFNYMRQLSQQKLSDRDIANQLASTIIWLVSTPE
jgi:hypothetical protein